ncbi:hypothetical protein [Salinisphaera orenii]|uniref:hypothetical protein n=1 Tax=Salinisphaera orenii TaxID=856731 RepID=UPI000DBE1E2C
MGRANANTLFPFTLAATVALAGCGGPTGPTTEQVKADINNRMTTAYDGHVHMTAFRISSRQVVAQDQVAVHVVAHFGVNEPDLDTLEHAADRTSDANRQLIHRLEQIEKIGEPPGKATMRYAQHASDDWQFKRLQPGFE